MNNDLIIISEYCSHSQVDPEFIFSLEEVGLINFLRQDNEMYIETSQLSELERYVRWHYELSINAEGIDVIQNLMQRIEDMQHEISHLKDIIKLLER